MNQTDINEDLTIITPKVGKQNGLKIILDQVSIKYMPRNLII